MTEEMAWSNKAPGAGWYFQRWQSDPNRWFIVEIAHGAVLGIGILPGDIEQAQVNGAEWAGPIKLPRELK